MKKVLCLILLLVYGTYASADPSKQIIFFGDSLTDDGNLYKLLFKVIPKSPPYFQGRFSDGPVWSDFVSQKYASHLNYAVGGSTAKLRNPFKGFVPYSLDQGVNWYLTSHYFDDKSQSLFVIWIGANDYLGNQTDVDHATTQVVDTIGSNIKKLVKAGAQKLLIINLPDLAKAPYSKDKIFKDNLHALTIVHNKKLADKIEELKDNYTNVEFITYDAFTMVDDFIANPDKYNKKYGTTIKNTTDACWTGGYTLQANEEARNGLTQEIENALIVTNKHNENNSINSTYLAEQILNSPALSIAYQTGKNYERGAEVCANPNEYLFWDLVHPTTAGHEIVAKKIWEEVLH